MEEKGESKNEKARPASWAWVVIEQDAFDYQGAAVADGTLRQLACSNCKTRAEKAIRNLSGEGE